ncbi:hypothetical protein KQI52_10495 [bacterium]|nr:hypothetical protein [bacterium]
MMSSFRKCLAFSRSKQVTRLVRLALRQKFLTMSRIEPSTPEEDRKGVDFWVVLRDGTRIGIDVKAQRNYVGWLALETWSSVEKSVVGWTLREDVLTEYVLWVWPSKRRFALVPFRPLRTVFREFGRDWYVNHPVSRQFTQADWKRKRPSYHSEIVLVPFHTVAGAMRELRLINTEPDTLQSLA